jgi:RNA polymerase sigma-70 factor (ECF subfamily)
VEVDSEAVERAANDGPADQSPEQVLTRQSLDADLQSALDALPEAFRQAVWLRDVEELSYAEMAKVLDVPIGTVMSRISRGRRALSEGLRSRRARAAAPSARMAVRTGTRE